MTPVDNPLGQTLYEKLMGFNNTYPPIVEGQSETFRQYKIAEYNDNHMMYRRYSNYIVFGGLAVGALLLWKITR